MPEGLMFVGCGFEDLEAVTNMDAAQLREYGAVTLDEPVVIDSRIISCRGPAQAIDVALPLLEDIPGPEASAEVRSYMMAEGL